MELPLKIKLQKPPNFIGVEDSAISIPVRQLSDDQIEEYILAWGEQFRKHVTEKQLQGPDS